MVLQLRRAQQAVQHLVLAARAQQLGPVVVNLGSLTRHAGAQRAGALVPDELDLASTASYVNGTDTAVAISVYHSMS